MIDRWTGVISGLSVLLVLAAALPSHAGNVSELEALFRAHEPSFEASSIEKFLPPDAAVLAWNSSSLYKSYILMYEATEDTYYLDRFIQLADRLWDVRADRLGVEDAVRGKMMPSWTSTRYSGGRPASEPVLTSMITYPLARFVWVVKQHPELAELYQSRADEYLPLLEESTDCHDDQWRNGPFDDEGEYGEISSWPTSLNRTHCMGRTLLMLWLVNGRPEYLDKVTRMAVYFKRRLTWEPDGSVNWGHFMPDPLGRPPWDEDISHAGATVDFAALCAQHGIVFTRRDIEGFAKTFRDKVCMDDGTFASTVSGRVWPQRWGYGSAMRWGRLLQFDSSMLETLEEQAREALRNERRKPWAGVAIPYLLIAERTNRWRVE